VPQDSRKYRAVRFDIRTCPTNDHLNVLATLSSRRGAACLYGTGGAAASGAPRC